MISYRDENNGHSLTISGHLNNIASTSHPSHYFVSHISDKTMIEGTSYVRKFCGM